MAPLTVTEKTERQLVECGKYYEMLDGFEKTVNALNMKAMDGEEVKCLQKHFIKLIPAFISLCGDSDTKSKGKAKEIENTLNVKAGWGLCPRCQKKCIKVNSDTVLVNCVMYCKVCKKEYVITWKAT